MHLRRIRISNLYSYEEIKDLSDETKWINLSDVNVIAGPNDSGKSNIFRVLRLLMDSMDHGIQLLGPEETFSRQAEPRLDVVFEINHEEAELIVDFLAVYPKPVQPGFEMPEVYSFRNRDKLIKSMERLLLEVNWTPSNTEFMFPELTLSIDALGIKAITNAANGPVYITDAFPFNGPSRKQEGLPAFIDGLADENPQAEFVALRDSKGWNYNILPINARNLANPTRNRAHIERLIAYAQPPGGRDADLSFFKLIGGIFRRNVFISSGGTIFHKKGLEFQRSSAAQRTIADEIKDSTRFSRELEYDGWNLAEFLFNLKNSHVDAERERFGRIQKKFTRLFPNLKCDSILLPLSLRNDPEPPRTTIAPGGDNDYRYPHIVIVNMRTSRQFLLEKSGAGISESIFLLTILLGLENASIFLDEPAVNLHPAQLKALFRIADVPSNQLTIITHSPSLLGFFLFDRGAPIVYIRRPDKASTFATFDTTELLKGRDRYRLSYLVDPRIFFARHIVLCEGETDRNFLEASAILFDLEPDTYEDLILHTGGMGNLPKYHIFLGPLGIPFVVAGDSDGRDDSKLEAAAMSYSGQGDYRMITKNMKDIAGCKVFFFKKDVEAYMRSQDRQLYSKLKQETGDEGKPVFMYEFIRALLEKKPTIFDSSIKPILEHAFEVEKRPPYLTQLKPDV